MFKEPTHDVSEGLISPRFKNFGLFGPWRHDLIVCLEMSVIKYQSMVRNIPEEQRFHLNRGWRLQSHLSKVFLK